MAIAIVILAVILLGGSLRDVFDVPPRHVLLNRSQGENYIDSPTSLRSFSPSFGCHPCILTP